MPKKETPKFQRCVDCRQLEMGEWHKRGLRVRGELRRRQVRDNEMRILEILIDLQFGRLGATSVVVPELKYFSKLSGMAEPHVHKAIGSLHLARVIRVVRVSGQVTYTVREDSENWLLRPRVTKDVVNETVSLLLELNGHEPLPRTQEELPNFKNFPDTENSGPSLTKKRNYV